MCLCICVFLCVLLFLRVEMCLGMRLLFVTSLVIHRALLPCYSSCCLDDGVGADGDISNHNITRQHEE